MRNNFLSGCNGENGDFFFQNKQLASAYARGRHFGIIRKPTRLMTLQKMALPSIIQRATSRHLRETAEGYSNELICDTYMTNVEECVIIPLSLVTVIKLFGHNKTNFPTLEFDKWSVNRDTLNVPFSLFCNEKKKKKKRKNENLGKGVH